MSLSHTMSIDEAFVEVEARAREREQALLVAGAIGGPFTIAVYTPLRNAITLGSKAQALLWMTRTARWPSMQQPSAQARACAAS